MTAEKLHGMSGTLKMATGTVPAASAAGTVTGSAIDRLGYDHCVLEAGLGASTGTPTSFTVDSKITHCETSGGTYTDLTGGAVTQLTAVNTRKKKSVSLKGAYRYLKVVTVAAFSGGSSPTIANAVTVILGGADTMPAQSDD